MEHQGQRRVGVSGPAVARVTVPVRRVLVLAAVAVLGVVGALGGLGAPDAAAQLGGQRLHVTAVTTGVQPEGNAIDVSFECAPPLRFPPSTLHFYGPGDQDLNAQGMGTCSLVVPKPKDALTLTVRCVASGDATCTSDRSVQAGAGEFIVTFTITAAFPATPPPSTDPSLPPAVPPTVPGGGAPPTTTSGAPLPTTPADAANPGGQGTPGGPGAAPDAAGPGGTTAGGADANATTGAGTAPANGTGPGAGGTGAGAGATGAGAQAASTATGTTADAASSVSPLVYLLVLLVVLACVAGGVIGGTALRRRLTPDDPEHPVGSAGTEGALSSGPSTGTAPAPGADADAAADDADRRA